MERQAKQCNLNLFDFKDIYIKFKKLIGVIMFSNMTIAKRLYIGFGTMMAIIVLSTIIGITKVNFIDKTLEEIVEVNSVKQRYAINFRGSVHDRAIAIRDVVLASSSSSPLFTKSLEDINKLEAFYADSAKPI